ncbi:MAG: adenylosuccinate synthetase [Planctomycetes bacterium]|nr:adenylosuccinate synthetase [Planctomycetota bacterium]
MPNGVEQAKGVEPASTCVVGLQWGDEAKGKIVDLLTDQHDLVVRYNGGANAGHTVVAGDKVFKFSLLPTGILRPNVRAVIANGVVLYPPQFLKEVQALRNAGIPVSAANLILSNHAHVIFPYHLEEERLTEQGGGQAIGTTKRGIGPCYSDKVGRACGIRVGELLDPAHLRKRLVEIVPRKNRLLRALAPTAEMIDVDRAAEPAASEPFTFDADALPYVTSSNSTAAGIWSGSGVSARRLKRVVGVIKAYSTRVGRGAFPTELDDGPDGIGELIRQTGKEFGVVTGRPRRCGWFDAVAVRHTVALNDVDELAVMLVDVLGVLDEVKICTAYRINGETTEDFPGDSELLQRCEPVCETLPGWRTDLSKARRLADLPAAARRYVDRLAELLGKRVSFISVGPDRAQTVVCS